MESDSSRRRSHTTHLVEESGEANMELKKLKELEREREHKLWMADKWKEYSLKNIEHTYDALVQQAHDEYEMEKQELLQEQKRLGKRKKASSRKGAPAAGMTNGNSYGYNQGGDNRMVTRTSSRRRGRESANKDTYGRGGMPTMGPGAAPSGASSAVGGSAGAANSSKVRKLNPPLISYTLTDDEIVQDLSLICNKGVLNLEEKKKLFVEAMHLSPYGANHNKSTSPVI